MLNEINQTERCGCPREGRPDGQGWHLDACKLREAELESRALWLAHMEAKVV